MKHKHRTRLAALAVLFAFALNGCGAQAVVTPETAATAVPAEATATPEATEDSAPPRLVILHTNDVHGRDMPNASTGETAIGDAEIAAMKQYYEANGSHVLLLSAGDFSQGTTLVNLSHGMTAAQFMNETGYDAACLGNHEFDWGYDNTLDLAAACDFPVLAANIARKPDGTLPFGDHTIFDFGEGCKVGVFGLDTPKTTTSTNPNGVKDLTFAAGEDLYACAQAQTDALTAEGCDLIVCLGHLGVDDDCTPNRSYDVIDHVQGIDVFIDGHSHMQITEQRSATLLQSAGCYSEAIGYIEWDGVAPTGKLLFPEDLTVAPDEAVLANVTAENDAITAKLSTVFAKVEVPLNGERAPGVRTEETNLGDLSADAFLWGAEQATGDPVDAAIVNGGGIRSSLAVGDLTMNDIKTVFPFSNTVCTIRVTGHELLEMLEANCASIPEPTGGFPQVAGMKFTVDTSVPYEQGELYPETTNYAPANPGSRVTITEIGGGSFHPDATYVIATNDFVAAGGDASYAFRYAGQTACIDTGLIADECMVNYIQTALGGIIGDKYAEPQGRITIR